MLWVCDPMHGNGRRPPAASRPATSTTSCSEVEASFDVHEAAGTHLGGVHFELTGDDVTECIGGGLSRSDSTATTLSACDPRLNYRQALEMAFRLAKRMGKLQP